MNIEVANRLQQLRKEKGYSQEQLAEALGISRQAVSKWERAESSPDTDNLICLAKLYGVSLDSLLSTEDSIEEIKEQQIQEEINDESKEEEESKIVKSLLLIITLSIVISYFAFSAIYDIWHPLWIIFLFIPILSSLVEAIIKRKPHHFAYPVLVTAAYLYFSFTFNVWHPLWVLFITIPVYYSICDIFKKEHNE